jgi:hypothetical protein
MKPNEAIEILEDGLLNHETHYYCGVELFTFFIIAQYLFLIRFCKLNDWIYNVRNITEGIESLFSFNKVLEERLLLLFDFLRILFRMVCFLFIFKSIWSSLSQSVIQKYGLIFFEFVNLSKDHEDPSKMIGYEF